MQFSFKTIKAPVSDILLKEKGSKFIGFAYPVSSENELKKALEELKELHPKATHHCYAFRMGMKGENYRANDDGEPSGSAGLPIFNQLLANELTDILLVVVRYYGGTKLGVSGLVKAYKECAKAVLNETESIVKELETGLKISFPFDRQNVIFTLLNKFDAKILDFQTEENCTIKAYVKTSLRTELLQNLSDMQHVSFDFDE